jgi:hypothetical protein
MYRLSITIRVLVSNRIETRATMMYSKNHAKYEADEVKSESTYTSTEVSVMKMR